MTAAALTQALNAIQALINWIASRGIRRDRIQTLLDEKAESGEDFTTAEIQTELDITNDQLDETDALINE